MTEQPLPTPGGQSVTRAVMADLAAREARGIETYGRSLETWNGRDAVQDLLEELLDGAQYCKQWQLERAQLLAVVEAALAVARRGHRLGCLGWACEVDCRCGHGALVVALATVGVVLEIPQEANDG